MLDVKSLLIDEISADQISENLKYYITILKILFSVMSIIFLIYHVNRHLTSVPHVAGTDQDLIQAEWVRDRFLEAGLDEAQTVPYDVLLSYPRPGVVNTVELIDETNRVNFTTQGRQPALGTPQVSYDKVFANFNAYSGKGVVEVSSYSIQTFY